MTSTGYSYTLAGRLSGMTYPSGAQVTKGRECDGRLNAATLYPAGGGTTYERFGQIASYTLGSGQTVTRTFDSTGDRLSKSTLFQEGGRAAAPVAWKDRPPVFAATGGHSVKKMDAGWIIVISVLFAMLSVILLSFAVQCAWLSSANDCDVDCANRAVQIGRLMWTLFVASAVGSMLSLAFGLYLRFTRDRKK